MAGTAVAAGLVLGLVALAAAHARGQTAAAGDAAPVTGRASGPFEVKMSPRPSEDKADPLGRMTFDKELKGALEGTSHGEMLTAMSPVPGSGVYVAVERVTAALAGRKGTFLLHHTGVMTRGAPQLSVSVVPDSGTGELLGISGKMAIRIEEGGKHFYDFDYSLPAPVK
jgi:hypothetical protein